MNTRDTYADLIEELHAGMDEAKAAAANAIEALCFAADQKPIMQALHDSEINCSVSSFFDGAWTAKLGDEMNGFTAEKIVGSYAEALEWLDQEARKAFPNSLYVTGEYPDGYRPDNPETSLLGA